MHPRHLLAPPLAEALFELKWVVGDVSGPAPPGVIVDPEHPVLVGLLYSRVREAYPCHETLPTEQLPAEMIPHQVQHQFRAGKGEWPLVQLGPGVLTLNVTTDYSWPQFADRLGQAVSAFWEVHPASDRLRIVEAQLRYINSLPFDWAAGDATAYLHENLGLDVRLAPELHDMTAAPHRPASVDLRLAYALDQPPSEVFLRYVNGRRDGLPALIWELVVDAKGEQAPQSREAVLEWAGAAHGAVEKWFFGSVRGSVEQELTTDGAE